MEMSFKSFDQIITESLPLIKYPKGDFWAHIDGKDSKTEKLYEHLNLVSEYLKQLVHQNNIEIIINGLINSLVNDIAFEDKEKAGHFIKEIFVNSILYHDLGKVNPNFQVKLSNPSFKSQSLTFGGQHSAPGAFLFCSIYIEKLLKEPFIGKDTNLLLVMVLLLSNTITRHHSSYIDVKDDIESFPIDEFYKFLSHYQINIEKVIITNVFNNSNFDLLKEQFAYYSSPKANFLVFCLIKLSFSLLTASDYYATGDYMSNMRIKHFGLIDKNLQKSIETNFKSLKEYNIDLFKNFDKYVNLNFDQVQDKSNSNLNKLRQKLNAEVISEIRKNINSNWYYIEAPTGAGKTNLSLACITELLRIDGSLNKVFYVFPFTTLITQTFIGIKDSIGLSNNDLVQVHSKAGLHDKESKEDGVYGNDKYNYIDYLFVNYPFAITTHVNFFDILKGNTKSSNYLFHRLCNSIVVLDEIQSYDPKHWDKIVYFFEHIAPIFNIRFIIMSATLPKIDALSETLNGKIISLTPNRDKYFRNPNFSQRIKFDLSMLQEKPPKKEEKESYLETLAKSIYNLSENYLEKTNGKVKTLVEFITKNSASMFFIKNKEIFADYHVYLLSGDILEPRRKEIIRNLKSDKHDKILLISTQVVEAGVDIDMDLGFKNHALIDSDEQLAGRVNRNASKNNCIVYLFQCDAAKTIYGKDLRYKQQQTNQDIYENVEQILINKTFHELYEKVFEERKIKDPYDGDRLENYLNYFNKFDFNNITSKFQLIENNDAKQLFIPVKIPLKNFDEEIHQFLDAIKVVQGQLVLGALVFERYKSIVKMEEEDFLKSKVDLKKIGGILSNFSINVYPTILSKLSDKLDKGENGQFGFEYLLHHENCYSFENGFDFSNELEDMFL